MRSEKKIIVKCLMLPGLPLLKKNDEAYLENWSHSDYYTNKENKISFIYTLFICLLTHIHTHTLTHTNTHIT